MLGYLEVLSELRGKTFFEESRQKNINFNHKVICKPECIIHTDLWKAYSQLENLTEYRYQHKTDNLCLCWKYSITGVHKNTIEALWNGVKPISAHVIEANR